MTYAAGPFKAAEQIWYTFTRWCYKYNIKALGLAVSDKIFFMFLAPGALRYWGINPIWFSSLLQFIRVYTVCYDKCNVQKLKFILIRKIYLWPLKTYNGQSHPYCRYLYEKINHSRINGKTHYKQDSDICKICLPYKIHIGLSGSDFVFLELWKPLWSVEWNHLWNFGRVHHVEQFC